MKNKIEVIIKKYKYSIYSFILAFLIGILVFSLQGRLIGGNRTFLHSDMLNQIVPFIKMFFRQLFVKHNILYSFDFALGSSTIPQYAFYSCFNPLNVILLLPIDLNISSFILVITKISLGAFAFHELSFMISKRKDALSIAMAVCYALCGYNIAYYHVLIWLDWVYFLPIIIMLIIDMFNDKKSSLLILLYAAIFIINFYTGYVIGIYTFIFFVLYLFVVCKFDIKKKLKIFGKYVLYVICAVMISCVIMLPTAVSIVKFSPEDVLGFDETIINVFDLLKQFFVGQSVDEVGYYPYVYCGMCTIIVALLFFVSKKIEKEIKILYGVILFCLALFSVTKIGYMFIHAFNSPDNMGHRYAYLYAFTLMLMFCYVRIDLTNIKKYLFVVLCFVLSIFVIIYTLFQKGPEYIENIPANKTYIVVINVIFLSIYVLILTNINKKKYMTNILAMVLLVELVLNGYLYKNMYLAPVYESKVYYDYFYNEQKKIVEEMKIEYDDGRVYMPEAMFFNNPQLMGYSGVDSFSSIINSNLILTMRRIGYRSNYLAMSEGGSTPLMRILLGQRYYVLCNNLATVNNGYTSTYYKAAALPIAYMSSGDIVNISIKGNNNPFDNQNALASALCGERIDYFYNTGEKVNITSENIYYGNALYNEEEVIGFELESDGDGYIDFCDDSSESEYAYFEMLESYSFLRSPILFNDLYGYYLSFKSNSLTEPKIVEMSKKEDGSHVYIILNEDTENSYYFKKAYFYGSDGKELSRAYDILSSGTMDIETLKDGYIKGRVVSTEDRNVLFTSIPYEDGWMAYIDGEKKDVLSLVDDTFLGIMIPEGEHEVILKFKDKWFGIGGIVSIFGIIGTIIVFCFNGKDKEELENEEK